MGMIVLAVGLVGCSFVPASSSSEKGTSKPQDCVDVLGALDSAMLREVQGDMEWMFSSTGPESLALEVQEKLSKFRRLSRGAAVEVYSAQWRDLAFPSRVVTEEQARTLEYPWELGVQVGDTGYGYRVWFVPGGTDNEVDVVEYRVRDSTVFEVRQFEQGSDFFELHACTMEDIPTGEEASHRLKVSVRQVGMARDIPEDTKLQSLVNGLLALRAFAFVGLSELGVYALRGFGTLKELVLSDSGVTDRAAAAIAKWLPHLEALEIPGSLVGDGGLAVLCRKLTSLRRLDLSRTSVTSLGANRIPSFNPGIEHLSMVKTHVNNDFARRLSETTMPTLSWLDLSRTKITGLGAKQLAQLDTPELKFLFLEGLDLDYATRLVLGQAHPDLNVLSFEED